MASHPPAQCCTIGVKHSGKPTGSMEMIGEIETYIAKPPSTTTTPSHPSTAIIFLTDVFGYKFPNNQLLADQYAANGYAVYMPGIFGDNPIPVPRPADFDIHIWLKSQTIEVVGPVVKGALEFIKGQGFQHIGAVGYCFGAKYVIRELAKGGGVDVGYIAHPSFVDEEEFKNVAKPLSIAAAETDDVFPMEKRHQSEKILKEIGKPYQINLFSGVEHGFAARANPRIKADRFANEQAFFQAVQWFDEHLAKL